MADSVAKRDNRISDKVSKLAFIHNQINDFEFKLRIHQADFCNAFKNNSYEEMLDSSRKIYENCTKLAGYREYEKLVVNNKV